MKVGILGLGYVGIPLALRFTEVGCQVLGFDIDEIKISALNNGQSFIEHIPSASIKAMCDQGFEATSDFSRAAEPDALIICVPTPLNQYREPDMSFVVGTIENIAPHVRKGQTIALESTTYPGTTNEIIRPAIEQQGFEIGKDVFLVYSPEREDPGNEHFKTQTIPKVVG